MSILEQIAEIIADESNPEHALNAIKAIPEMAALIEAAYQAALDPDDCGLID